MRWLELQDILQTGLAMTPSGKWCDIIPHLFSRLNYPVRMVRNRISELLCRIAEDYPHLIIYPAVVGSGSRDKFSKLLTSTISDELPDSEVNPELPSAHAQIVDLMTKANASSVEQVQNLVRVRAAVDLPPVGRTVKKSLVSEKYNIIFKPLLYVLEKVVAITSSPPETPHEAAFIKKYGEFIENMMEKLRSPADPSKPKEAWPLVAQFQTLLTQRVQKKNQLRLSEISSSLYQMRRTQIPMPGIVDQKCPDIDRFDNNLTILLTKTKPKKIAVYGNDGKKYSYLFKGLEDLHLDERIMQFLSIANVMIRKSGGEYNARHYSVVPLGPRSGLIQWVEGAIPMFGLFKKWQQRQADQKRSGGVKTQKPSEIFYSKLIPKLREQGITNLDSRKDWPTAVLKQVLQELIDETPNNILSQEIWFASVSSQHWYTLVRNLTRSIAVMSVIGYIIGLGDRHLDNLLVDLNTGEIIHIDYNICFEKGKHLRIPERVPCRLSQNIVKVFGVTGLEGAFRLSCEHTLDVMRKGRETLLTLLEAFVYDPLVDWTAGNDPGLTGTYQGRQNADGAQDKKDMHIEITFSMFGVRVAEMKGPWFENKKALFTSIGSVEDCLAAWIDIVNGIQGLNEYLTKMHQSMSILKEAEANPAHRLYALQDRFIEHRLIESAVQVAQAKVVTFIEENEKWANLYQRAMATLQPNHLSKWNSEIGTINIHTHLAPATKLVHEFLDNAGQTALKEQLEMVESAFCTGIDKLKADVQICIQMLGHYNNIASLYPASYRVNHRTAQQVKWMRRLNEDFSVQTCAEITAEFKHQFIDQTEVKTMKQHHIMNLNYQMDQWTQEIDYRLQNIFQRMINENIESGTAVMGVVTAAKIDLQQHLQDASDGTRMLFSSLVVDQLVRVGTKVLSAEATASAATDNIIDLTSSDGEWFLLDEINMKIGFVAEMLDAMDLLGILNGQCVPTKALYKLQGVVKQLQHLNTSFFAIIMLEGIKCFQREENSVLEVAINLNEILNDAGLSLDELIQDLDVHIRYSMSDLEAPNEAAVGVARSIKKNFQDMVSRLANGNNDNMSSGHMLFLAFNSLFDNVDMAMQDLKATMTKLDVPESWNGIDCIAEAKGILSYAFNDRISELVMLTSFMHRLLVLKEYFSLMVRYMRCFKADEDVLGQMFPTGDEIARPVKTFVAEYYRRQLIGVGSFNMAATVCKYISATEPDLLTNLPEPTEPTKLTLTELGQAFVNRKKNLPGKDRAHFFSLELNNLSQQLHKLEVARYLEQNIEALHSNQQMSQLQRNSFQWFHESDLMLESPLTPPVRSTFMGDLRGAVAMILILQKELMEKQVKFHELHGTVEQRMKWACGANPDLQEVFDSYLTCYNREMDALKKLGTIVKSVSSAANTVLHHEALRTQTREAVNRPYLKFADYDSDFMALIGECQESASLKESQQHTLAEHELTLFTMNPPKDMINNAWIRETEESILQRVKKVQEEVGVAQNKAAEVVKSLKVASGELRSTVTTHQKLMADVGALLRTIAKAEDYEFPDVLNYLGQYKDFSELVSSVLTDTMSDDITEESVEVINRKLDRLKEIIQPIYEKVVSFSSLLKEDNLEMYKKKGSTALIDGGQTNQMDRLIKSTEEKNTYALNVLRRVRIKLEGREPDALRKVSVPEQVDFIIREATSLDNLALMYEGWTAWI